MSKREKDQKPNEKTSLSGRLTKKFIIVLQKHSDFHIFKIKILVRRLLVNLRLFHDSRSLERSQWKLLMWYVKSEISIRICKIVKKKKKQSLPNMRLTQGLCLQPFFVVKYGQKVRFFFFKGKFSQVDEILGPNTFELRKHTFVKLILLNYLI